MPRLALASSGTPPSAREADRLRAVAQRVPANNAGALNNCGVMLARRGLSLEAAACFERALDLESRMSLAAQNLQQLASRTTVDAERVRELTDRLRDVPHDTAASLALGKWHARLGRPTDAAVVLGSLLDRSPDDLAALREIALVEQSLGAPERASAWLDRALDIAPDDVALHALSGEILYRRGKIEAARVVLERALTIDESAAWPQHLLAFVLGDLGQLTEAQAAAQRALELDPSLARVDMHLTLDARPPRPAARVTMDADGRAHLHLGIAYRNTGYLDQALSSFETALLRGEPASEVHVAIAETHAMRRAWAHAASAYADASNAAPDAPMLSIARAAMLLLDGDLLSARDALRPSLGAETMPETAYLVQGVIEALDGRSAEALRSFQRVRGAPRLALAARMNAAWVMRQLGRHAECLEGFRRVTEADPQNARAWIGVGVAFSELRRLNEACSAFERASNLAPDNADAAYHHAFILSQLGRYQDGVRAMKKAMGFAEDFAPFRFQIALDPHLTDVSLEVVANDAVNGDAMALMMLSGASRPQVTAEQSVQLAAPTVANPLQAAVTGRGGQRAHQTPMGAWVALRRGGTPVTHTGVAHREAHPTPVLPFARSTPQPAADQSSRQPSERVDRDGARGVESVTAAHAAPGPPPQGVVPPGGVRSAEMALRTALARDPDLAQVRVGLAALLREEGRVHQAESELLRALESVPTFHDAARALAELRVDMGRPSEAMQALVRPLRANPRDADLLVALAEALFALGREEQGCAAIARAAAIEPDHAGVRMLQGNLSHRAGRESDAVQHWHVAACSAVDDRWAVRARLALAEHDDAAVPHTPVAMGSVRLVAG